MRRRAASNNPKRLPKALQELISKSDLKPKKKRKINKRRIATRNKDPRRTLLHLWFAKRFKLEFKWNQLVPYKNNNKNQRVLFRCSKRGYTVFYMSFIKSFLIEYQQDGKSKLIELIARFCSKNDLEILSTTSDDIQFNFYLYQKDQYPLKLIGPCSLVWISNSNYLLVSTHISIYNDVVDIFSSNNFLQILQDFNCSHIRLYGSKAKSLLTSRLSNSKDSCHEIDVKSNELTAFQTNDKTFTKMNLLDFIESCRKDIKECKTIDIALKLFSQNSFEAVDVIIKNCDLKIIWNKINRNMSTLVGGLRDMQVMAVNSSSLLFPKIGFVDSDLCEMKPTHPLFKDIFVIRDTAIIEKLIQLNFDDVVHTEKAFITVSIDFIKGTPRENDTIYLPNDGVINYFKDFVEQYNTDCRYNFKIEKDNPIGYIEFGCFSMEVAKCRAIGFMSLVGYEQLVKLCNTKLNDTKKLYALVKTIFNHVNLVTISVLLPKDLI